MRNRFFIDLLYCESERDCFAVASLRLAESFSFAGYSFQRLALANAFGFKVMHVNTNANLVCQTQFAETDE